MKLLGHGSYACVIRPEGSRKVLKVFFDKGERAIEWRLYSAIARVDPDHEFTVAAYGKGMLSCRNFPVLFEEQDMAHHFLDNDTAAFITYEYGGPTLTEGLLTRYHIVDILDFFRPLFAGLVLMRKARVLHFDIKGANLVFSRRKGLRFIDFGFADQYTANCANDSARYLYHPVECTMLSYLFGSHRRLHSPEHYHGRLQAAVAAGHIDVSPGPWVPDETWMARVLEVLGYKHTPAHVKKLTEVIFRGAVTWLAEVHGSILPELTMEHTRQLFRDRLAEFVAAPTIQDALRTMVKHNYEAQSKADVYALGIQLCVTFWDKHRSEKQRGNPGFKTQYADILHLVYGMTAFNVQRRMTADAALRTLDSLIASFSAGLPKTHGRFYGGPSLVDTDTELDTDVDTVIAHLQQSGVLVDAHGDDEDDDDDISTSCLPHLIKPQHDSGHGHGRETGPGLGPAPGPAPAPGPGTGPEDEPQPHRGAPVSGSSQGPLNAPSTRAVPSQGGQVSGAASTKDTS